MQRLPIVLSATALVVALLGWTPLVGAAGKGRALTGVEVVTKTSAVDSTTSRKVTVACPADKVAIGGGAMTTIGFVAGVPGPVAVQASGPTKIGANPTEWVASAREIFAYKESWALVAAAVCAPAG